MLSHSAKNNENQMYQHQLDAELAALQHRLDAVPEDDYQARFEIAQAATRFTWQRGSLLSRFEVRRILTTQYAFAIPCKEALDILATLAPLVEMGAGTGYWAYLLRKRGVDIQAYDKRPGTGNHYKFTKRWTGVVHGLPGKLKKRADRTLFLCWPDYNTPFASRCLEYYRGNTVVYVGEGWGGCTGDDQFYTMLERDWTQIEEVRIPQWEGLHDWFCVYRRNGT